MEEYTKLQNEFMNNLKNEIDKIEIDIDKNKSKYRKRKLLRLKYRTLCLTKLILPYLISFIITFTSASCIHGTPFIIDSYKKNYKIMEEIDSFGKIKITEQLKDFSNPNSTLTFYSKWEKNDNNTYFRNIETYSIDDIDESKILNIINDVDLDEIVNLFNKPIVKKVETKNYLSNNEFNDNSYIEACLYYENQDKYIVIKESFDDNLILTGIYLLLLSLINICIKKVRISLGKFDFLDEMESISIDYSTEKFDNLKKSLKIKKENYDRLRGLYDK